MTLLDELKEINDEEKKFLTASKEAVNQSEYTNQQEFVIESSKFLKDNSLIITRKHPRFVAFPMHKHDYIELNYVYSGTLKQTIGNQQITLEKGEMLFLNQHIEHALDKCSEEDVVINFIIHPQFFDYILQELEKEEQGETISRFLFQSLFDQHTSGSYLYFKVSDEQPIQKLMEQMIEEMMNKTVFSEIKMKFTMGLLLVELMKSIHLLESKEINYDYKLMNNVMHYINYHYQDASLSEIAEKSNIKAYNLSKLIKTNLGRTFKEIVQEKRINEAKKLLRFEEKSVEEIAQSVGYDNTSYFYRLFKQLTGSTPNEYRKV